jgi:hypothetical protein
MTKTWWETPMGGSVLSFLKAEKTEPPIGVSHQVLVIWLNSYKEEDI